GKRPPEDGEVDVRGAPRIRVVLPWVRARLHGDEAVVAVVISERPAGAGEVRVEQGRMTVAVVAVAARGVCLPDLDQGVPHRAPVLLEQPACHGDPLAERVAVVLASEVIVEFSDVAVAVDGASKVTEVVRPREQRA